jgi:hypothetical protein
MRGIDSALLQNHWQILSGFFKTDCWAEELRMMVMAFQMSPTRFPKTARTKIFASRTRLLFFSTTPALKLTDYFIFIDAVCGHHFVESRSGLLEGLDLGFRTRLPGRDVISDSVAMSGNRDRLVALQQVCRQ